MSDWRPRDIRKPLTEDDPRHGTFAGVNAHRREDSPLCEVCREFARDYMRERRRTKETTDPQRSAARSRALTRLANLYPDDYHRIYAEECLVAVHGRRVD